MNTQVRLKASAYYEWGLLLASPQKGEPLCMINLHWKDQIPLLAEKNKGQLGKTGNFRYF
jgi:hypothetical protein